MIVSRRTLIAASALTAAPIPAWARAFTAGQFTHGVASGDPTSSRVVLWTRFLPQGAASGEIGWEVSEDENFARIARRGVAVASVANNYCAKVDVAGLQPGRRYFYRFLSAAGPSMTGRTRTAPNGPTPELRLAFFSCSNFPFGYFHAYADAAARDEIDLCLHLGDYIYETPRGVYPGPGEGVDSRVIEPAGETIRLSDYNARYATYHTDPDLQALRASKPLSVVWDDHEITNDAWRDGAQNHQPETEGTWANRIAAASKAYFDWMPIRRPDPRTSRLYRSLDWGDLARIILLDTRYIGRDQQLNYARQLFPRMAQGGADARALAAEFRRDLLDVEQRTLMGRAQEDWFARSLAESKRRGQPWQIIGQQLVMGEQRAPQDLLNLVPPSFTPQQRSFFNAGVEASALGLPWNLDAWGGYPAARRRALEACVAQGANAVFLGGDSHNCWVNNLRASSGDRLAALEFAGGSVTSPGFERTLTNAAPGGRENVIRSANPDMAFCDLTNRGYGALHITRGAIQAEWRASPDIRNQTRGAFTPARFAAEASPADGPSAWLRN